MNRLADQSSPYLRQHADNPVQWWPWGPEAFAEAERRDVPVLISIGYSACHWCHVMAHESFEDPAVAAVVNAAFVAVKVDREERPDVDDVYMEATQAMTGSGGWPMTVFATADGRPFFAGTYFPRDSRGQALGFVELCQRVDELWRTRRADLVEQAGRLTAELGRTAQLDPVEAIPAPDELDEAVARLLGVHDATWGGFGGAPKFPQVLAHDALWRAAVRAGPHAAAARAAAELSLDRMAAGGIYDHLAGGFARYSVDGRWLVPHFEKMLYDNAQLIRLYLHGWQVTGHQRHHQVMSETVRYVLRELAQPEGGLSSAQDADSEGVEGRYYVWTPAEVAEVLEAAGLGRHLDLVLDWYGVRPDGNFEGATVLNRLERPGVLERPAEVEAARVALLAHRATRVPPALDDKVLTEWNALAVSALAEAGAASGEPGWVDAAVGCADFLLTTLRRSDGRWLRAWQRHGGARHLAFAADHAALVDAFCRLAEATGQARWLREATTAADALLELFWDHERGGVLTSGRDAERLVVSGKDLTDDATPSANGMAALALARLGALTGSQRYHDAARDVLRLVGRLAVSQPAAFGQSLAALEAVLRPVEIVVAGDRPDLLDTVRARFLPTAVLAWGERTEGPLWSGRADGSAYACRGYVCALPAADATTLAAQLDSFSTG